MGFKSGDKVFVHKLKLPGYVVNSLDIEDKHGLDQLLTIELYDLRDDYGKAITKQFLPHEISKYKHKKYNPNEMLYMVKDFHKAFDHPRSESPKPLDRETVLSRSVWTGEEIVELLHATVEDPEDFLKIYLEFKEGLDKAYKKMKNKNKDDNKLVAQADALTDQLYFVFGSFVHMGVKPFNLFKIVQEANMSKIWPDGKPHYREEDGKIQKPEGWEPPEPKLKKEIERQQQKTK